MAHWQYLYVSYSSYEFTFIKECKVNISVQSYLTLHYPTWFLVYKPNDIFLYWCSAYRHIFIYSDSFFSARSFSLKAAKPHFADKSLATFFLELKFERIGIFSKLIFSIFCLFSMPNLILLTKASSWVLPAASQTICIYIQIKLFLTHSFDCF